MCCNLSHEIQDNVLNTSSLVREIYANLSKASVPDLAYSVHAYLARGLAALAIEKAQAQGTRNVGFTGGAACNQILAEIIRKKVETAGLKFFVHEQVPAGDGGVSFGQAIVASISSF